MLISKPFYLGKHEVTQAQWQEVMGTNPSHFKGDPNRPVERVSWQMVQEFISKLNAREGHTRYRLPTEAEWEYAARAGSTAKYYFGDDDAQLEQYAWFNKNDKGTTHPVGQLKPNAWGLYDMTAMFGNGCMTGVDRTQQGKKSIHKALRQAMPKATGVEAGAMVLCVAALRIAVMIRQDYIYGTHGFRLAMTAQ